MPTRLDFWPRASDENTPSTWRRFGLLPEALHRARVRFCMESYVRVGGQLCTVSTLLIYMALVSVPSIAQLRAESPDVIRHNTSFNRYLSLLREGATYHGVNKDYQLWLADLPSVPSRDAEAYPERTNTPSQAATNMAVAVSAVTAIVVAICRSGFLGEGL